MNVIGGVTIIANGDLLSRLTSVDEKEVVTSNYIREVIDDNEELIVLYDYFPIPELKYDVSDRFLAYDNEEEVVVDVEYTEKTLSIAKKSYVKMKSTGIERTSIGFDAFYRELQRKRSDKLTEITNTLITDRKNSELIHTYYIVKQIIYREDFNSDTSKQVDYIRYPTETMIDAEGDCKDKTALFIAIATELGYDVGYAWYPTHVTPLIRTMNINAEFYTSENIITINDKEYVPIEVTENIDFHDAIKKTEDLIVGRADEFNYSIHNYEKAVTHVKEMINTYTDLNTN